ncbi:MAG: o-succinylbenzoate synthase [Proteobacteria bacterium]|uniref:O-succinylbenzoate synthase n=1 Tax=Candidatus Avisuccinivibrio stercorigallinarum TaxID=2840704 RepID=A0A9D9DAB7_9GAMM|nr:o-succinylbenzoate synthase [Candidatus Avisuccinivibrio stercorigallinarum]
MKRQFKFFPKTLYFKFKAGTSRGVYTSRDTYFIAMFEDGELKGVGECAPLRGLSAEYKNKANFEQHLAQFVARANKDESFSLSELTGWSSILCAFETALMHGGRQSLKLFDNDFTQGKADLKINGLIWMGSYAEMQKRIEEKLASGFKCLKLKIGAIDFDKELELLRLIRQDYPASVLTLRVDANGAFGVDEAMDKLEALSRFELHSIEQPIKAGQWDALARLCASSPVPVALDEELIGLNSTEDKLRLLESVRPQYLVIKPSLHGGLRSTLEWTNLAREHNIGLWITSALESNLGLNMLAQLTSSLKLEGYQGLGTGQLYTNNLPFPALELTGENLHFNAGRLPAAEDLWHYLQH